MKKIYNLLIIAALLAVSCEKSVVESPTVETEPEQEIVYPEIQVALSVDTKTTISENGDSFSIAFAVDDDIAVFNGEKDAEDHLPCRYRCTRIEGGVAYFSYNPTSDAEKAIVPDTELAEIVATYPYRGTTTCGYGTYGSETVKIRMVNAPSSSSSGFAKQALPLIACADAGDQLSFHHTDGLMQLKLKGSDVSIKKIAVTSDKNIVGDAKVEYSASEPALEVVGTDGTGGISNFKKATYTFNDSDGLQLDSDGVDFYIGLPEGTHNLSLLITDAENNTMLISAPSVPISRGVVIPTTLTYKADPLSNLTNLSEFGHFANCYVVSKAGNYCFNARKPDGTPVSGTAAAWVWASGEACNGASDLPSTMMSAISLSNGKVYFTVPSSFKVGNVVLGIVDGSSNLLYTWHIWLTSDDMADITTDGITVMDRNLGAGALYDVSAGSTTPLQAGKGCFYQWGRKDPILGGRNTASSSGESTAFTNGSTGQFYILNTNIPTVADGWKVVKTLDTTIEGGAANPVTMTQDQTGTPGYIAGSTADWSSRSNANPCPYGYSPISKAQIESLKEAGMVASYLSSSNGWWQVALGTIGVIFPRGGARNYSDGKAFYSTGASSYAACWTNSASSATASYVAKVTWASNTALNDSPWTVSASRNSFGYNVRCVKDGGI